MERSTRPAPISVYIRTKNEERCLRNVLQAVRNFVDEIIIIDSGSTDSTLRIAEEYDARVVHQAWLGSGFQKRVGEEVARNDWLLDLDGDEVVSPQLGEEIAQLFAHGEPRHSIYLLRQSQVFPSGRVYLTAGMRPRAKLYDRRKIRIPADSAADQFKVPRSLRAGKLRGPLLHYGFPDLGSLVRKQEAAMTRRLLGTPRQSKRKVVGRLLITFPLIFFKKYIQQGLWKAGVEGLSLSVICAFSNWLKFVKIYERDCIQKVSGPPPVNVLSKEQLPSEQRKRAA